MSGRIEQSGIYKAIAIGLSVGMLVGTLGGYGYGWVKSGGFHTKETSIGLVVGIPGGLSLGLLGGVVCWAVAFLVPKLLRTKSDATNALSNSR